MPLVKLQFRPGINQEVTSYSNEGGWRDCDKVRFHAGFPEKIGGWMSLSTPEYRGSARSIHNWTTLSGDNYLSFGTDKKYYISEDSSINDITPVRSVSVVGAVTFSLSDSVITVTHANHGSSNGDFVTFSGVTGNGNNIFNSEFEISSVTPNSYIIEGSVLSGSGGTTIVATYQINIGLNTVVTGKGWGSGGWSRLGWGSGIPLTSMATLRRWSNDNFGEDLIINPRDGGIYYWSQSDGFSTPAVEVSDIYTDLSDADNTTARSVPQVCKQIIVSDHSRHVIAFGCDNISSSETGPKGDGIQDSLLIRFSDQENVADWYPSISNSAGFLRLGGGSEFIQAIETKREIIVWTDTSVTSLRFVGSPFVFALQPIATNTTIAGPNSAVSTEDFVFWMGIDNFYVYSGQTQQIPCPVRDKVFLDFNRDQRQKVTAGVNSEYSEVIWFYPSESSEENDRYVIFNYTEKVWYFGNLGRDVWLDRGTRPNPIALSNGKIYLHEMGHLDDGDPMYSFIESAEMDIGEGDQFSYINRLIPDMTFADIQDDPTLLATVEMKATNFPGNRIDFKGPKAPIEMKSNDGYTNQLYLRLRGRSFAMRIESSANLKWKIGSPRVEVKPDGMR